MAKPGLSLVVLRESRYWGCLAHGYQAAGERQARENEKHVLVVMKCVRVSFTLTSNGKVYHIRKH